MRHGLTRRNTAFLYWFALANSIYVEQRVLLYMLFQCCLLCIANEDDVSKFDVGSYWSKEGVEISGWDKDKNGKWWNGKTWTLILALGSVKFWSIEWVFQMLDARQSKATTGSYLAIITVYHHAMQCNAMTQDISALRSQSATVTDCANNPPPSSLTSLIIDLPYPCMLNYYNIIAFS